MTHKVLCYELFQPQFRDTHKIRGRGCSPKERPTNDDLIFSHPKQKGPGPIIVALYRDLAVWHARLEQGVVRQTWGRVHLRLQCRGDRPYREALIK
jgi:hypothetical protein